ncbi:hypothetical protein BU23DRAFT_487200 [Bimuria novae-zelandiae CBS 107.79]|uniref:Uncharacterized protein n=1 Tax=Bimuria novae-zelandiae CBS 107.79 TaxID=1447943 RepID=A0A6A5UQN9_9PLEO|nr:hypothetical protein BU23DRAFT_487200 [Bimuria novae-zelandiae CBS 107.79]
MIEKENDPFINKRLAYVVPHSEHSLLPFLLGIRSKEKSPGNVNKKHYEHNRRLEGRKTIENGGSRLRIARFGFRHAIYPPHTPEMDELGLTRAKYDTIVGKIEDIRLSTEPTHYECVPNFFQPWTMIRRRNATDTLSKVSEYTRELNAAGRRVVWTIEEIPGLYDQGIGHDKHELEISAWNGKDPWELTGVRVMRGTNESRG